MRPNWQFARVHPHIPALGIFSSGASSGCYIGIFIRVRYESRITTFIRAFVDIVAAVAFFALFDYLVTAECAFASCNQMQANVRVSWKLETSDNRTH